MTLFHSDKTYFSSFTIYGMYYTTTTVVLQYHSPNMLCVRHSSRMISNDDILWFQPLKDIAVVSGKTARFECIVQGEPVSDITWSCNGLVLENSECYQAQYRNGVCRLTIPKTYKCECFGPDVRCGVSSAPSISNTLETVPREFFLKI